jgi:hypothetical protein
MYTEFEQRKWLLKPTWTQHVRANASFDTGLHTALIAKWHKYFTD